MLIRFRPDYLLQLRYLFIHFLVELDLTGHYNIGNLLPGDSQFGFVLQPVMFIIEKHYGEDEITYSLERDASHLEVDGSQITTGSIQIYKAAAGEGGREDI